MKMAPFKTAPKAVARLIFCRNLFLQQITYHSSLNRLRFLSSIARASAFSSSGKIVGGRYKNCNISDLGYLSHTRKDVSQRRGFLECSDGGDENVLRKVYEERRVLGYSPEQLFNVVAAVDMYQDFLPWCQRSDILRRNPDATFDAELEIGFKFLVESYVSHVELSKPKYIKTASFQSNLFDHLISV